MKKYITKLFVATMLYASGNVWADQAANVNPATMASNPSSMLLYIQPTEYTHPIKLWHYYRDYWFEQGPVVEALAMAKLSQSYQNVSMCEGNQSGKTLVWLQPRLFYNPQVEVFYGKVTANVYTGMGRLAGSYVGESKWHGYLDIMPQRGVEKAYQLAIDDMVAKMQADSALQSLLGDTSQPDNAEATPCSMVTLLPTPKIRAMSF